LWLFAGKKLYKIQSALLGSLWHVPIPLADAVFLPKTSPNLNPWGHPSGPVLLSFATFEYSTVVLLYHLTHDDMTKLTAVGLVATINTVRESITH